MKTSNIFYGGVRSYVSIIPAIFPAIVFLMISANSQPRRMSSAKIEMTPFVDRVREIYTSQIGVREKFYNTGPEVEKYLKYVNLPKGNPWCAAFVCWVFGEAGVGNPRTGWSPSLFPSRKVIWQRGERGKVKGEREFGIKHRTSVTRPTQTSDFRPQTSDIFALYFPEKGRIAHVGFIDQWDGTWLISVEGNTNVSGSREGDGVYRKRRLVRSVYKVARYIE